MDDTPLKRSEFLKLLALGGAGLAFLRVNPERAFAALGAAQDEALAGARQALDEAALNGDSPAARAAGVILAVAKGTSADSNVKRAVAAVGGMKRFVHAGNTVVIKPNIAHAIPPKYAVTTSPGVVASLVRLARAAGASKVLVMDNSSGGAPAACYAASGVAAAVKAAGGTMVVMGAPGFKTYAIPGHLLKKHPVYGAIVNANVLINVPIAKQHHSTGLTLAGKNMMGAISNRSRLHQLGLSQSIAEINAFLRPELTVIDAMRILVRHGPGGGKLSDVAVKNTVVACADWVAADAYTTRLFGKSPGFVPYINAATRMGLGRGNLSGVTIRKV
jgi:uncharacterized protein (DUF362 family)